MRPAVVTPDDGCVRSSFDCAGRQSEVHGAPAESTVGCVQSRPSLWASENQGRHQERDASCQNVAHLSVQCVSASSNFVSLDCGL